MEIFDTAFSKLGLHKDGWLITIGVGLVAGWLAALLVGRRNSGLLPNLVVGVLGSLIGPPLFSFLGIEVAGYLGLIAKATGGAVALLFTLKVLNRVL